MQTELVQAIPRAEDTPGAGRELSALLDCAGDPPASGLESSAQVGLDNDAVLELPPVAAARARKRDREASPVHPDAAQGTPLSKR